MYSYLSPEEGVPADHPLRPVREMCGAALQPLSRRFARLYSRLGRRSVAPEKLMRAVLLQVLYSIRSERLRREQLNYNLLFRWFVGLSMDETVWDATVFSKNRERLLRGDLAQAFFGAILQPAREKDLLSDEHFTVDGTLLEAWASKKRYQKKEEPPPLGSGSRGEVLLRGTHECKTEAARVTEAITDAEWETALERLGTTTGQGGTVGADAGYGYARFVEGVRALGMKAHVAQHTKRPSSIDGRTTRHPGYEISLKKRKRIEQIFGWLKTTGTMRKLRHRGRELVQWMFTLALSAYNLVRLRSLTVQAANA